MTEVCAPYHLPISARADVRDVDAAFLCLRSLRGQGLPRAFEEKEVFLLSDFKGGVLGEGIPNASVSVSRIPAPLDGEGARLKECKTNLLPFSAIKRIKKECPPCPV